jgi:hypothetical protein
MTPTTTDNANETNWLTDATQAAGFLVLNTLGRFKAAAKAFIRPQIETDGEEIHDITTMALVALLQGHNNNIYVRADQLSRLRQNDEHQPVLESLDAARLKHILVRNIQFLKQANVIDPPHKVVADILALGEWPFPSIIGITEVPVMRADGTILDKPGYDPATRLYYWQNGDFTMPRMTTKEAVALLQEVIHDFPFVEESSRANALGLMLTPIVRPAIKGHVPLALIDAPGQGTGKGLLSNVVSLIATGKEAPKTTAPDNDEEWRKKITSLLMRGATMITIDNLDKKLSSGHLASALTCGIWEDRILGESGIFRGPQRAVWMATGNNISLGGDMQRRCYSIRMDAKVEQPWLRAGFLHPKLKAWVMENRARLIGALLTRGTAWFEAGQPTKDVIVVGEFESWSEVIGGIVKYAGVKGFLGNLQALYELNDEDAEEWTAFLMWLTERFKEFTSADVVTTLEGSVDNKLPTDLANEYGKRGFSRKLGHALRAHAERRFGGLRLVRVGTSHSAAVWEVKQGS